MLVEEPSTRARASGVGALSATVTAPTPACLSSVRASRGSSFRPFVYMLMGTSWCSRMRREASATASQRSSGSPSPAKQTPGST